MMSTFFFLNFRSIFLFLSTFFGNCLWKSDKVLNWAPAVVQSTGKTFFITMIIHPHPPCWVTPNSHFYRLNTNKKMKGTRVRNKTLEKFRPNCLPGLFRLQKVGKIYFGVDSPLRHHVLGLLCRGAIEFWERKQLA